MLKRCHIWNNVSVKDQTVNILGFADHIQSLYSFGFCLLICLTYSHLKM